MEDLLAEDGHELKGKNFNKIKKEHFQSTTCLSLTRLKNEMTARHLDSAMLLSLDVLIYPLRYRSYPNTKHDQGLDTLNHYTR